MDNKYSSKNDTLKHIKEVRKNIMEICTLLVKRAESHDESKLNDPEIALFDEYTPKLAGCTYGSDEYKKFLIELKPALDHHYKENKHHPEHFEDGIKGMNLVDIIEMFCDWVAATRRHDNGNIWESLNINKKRFKYSDDLQSIFENTAVDIFNVKRE